MNIKLRNRIGIKDVGIKLVITFAFLAATVIMYVSGVGCMFRYLLGIRCAGCGLTRAYISLFKLDFISAFEYHSLFWTIPPLYLYFLYDGHILGKTPDTCILCGIFIALFVRWLILLI